MNKKLSNVVLPPSDEGGGFCKAKDGGREDMKTLQKLPFFSLPQSRFTRQLPRQREPRNLTDQFTGASNSCMAGRPTKKRTCAPPVSVRAMPENEIPPAMRGDIYSVW